MSYSVVTDESFELELEQIISDIIDSYTLDYAHRVVNELESSRNLLELSPKIYAIYGDDARYRKFVVGKKYMVFYIINDDAKIVRLAHIFASMRDLPTLLD